MFHARLYPESGLWEVRFSPSQAANTWNLEFHDPATGCQTIPAWLRFRSWPMAALWLLENVVNEQQWEEVRPQAIRGTASSEHVGQLVLDLHLAGRLNVNDWTPWFYSTYLGRGCGVLDYSSGKFTRIAGA